MFSGHGIQRALDPNNFTHFYVLWGIFALVVGWALPVLFPPSVVNTHFYSNGIWFGGMGVPGLALRIVWYVWSAGMVTDCGPTLRCGWFIFCFFSNILFCVSVVSSLVFDVIWPWNISASFLSSLSFMCLKVKTGQLLLDFSVR